jgi:hypothetical protein
MELNVLVEAKKEYTGQLCKLLCPHMIESFLRMYTEANKLSKGKRPLIQYQKLLQEVPNWNDHIVKQNCESVCNACSWFSDLLAAVFVSYVKILSSVRLKSETKKISIKLPTNEMFIHTCFVNAAKDLYKDPYVYHEVQNEFDRDAKLTPRFTAAIEATIQELLPVQQILTTYMSQTGNQVDLNTEDPVEDTEDPDVDEGEATPEGVEPAVTGEEGEQATPEGVGSEVPPPAEAPLTTPDGVGSAPEIKNVPVSGEGAETLFDDAPEKTSGDINGH